MEYTKLNDHEIQETDTKIVTRKYNRKDIEAEIESYEADKAQADIQITKLRSILDKMDELGIVEE